MSGKRATRGFSGCRRCSRFGTAEDITVEDRNRRADLADTMMQEFKRLTAEKGRT
jgi:hypothetical protein